MVGRGFLTAIDPAAEIATRFSPASSGRIEMAEWIADPRNPLTARVYANRVWSWLMGEGLVASENNFGTTGQSPSHPQLLDWLAIELIHHGWSTKHLVRQIVSSSAYRRRIVKADPRAMQVDPENRLFWSANLKRLNVEAIRDAMLTISGELDAGVGGRTIRPGVKADYGYVHDLPRRSIYQPVLRNSLPPLFGVFDFANSSVSVGQRAQSTVATQSLVMMNHPWVIDRSRRAAKRMLVDLSRDGGGEPTGAIVDAVYRKCLSRLPNAQERDTCIEFLGNDVDEAKLQQLIQSLLASIDFRYLE